MYFCAHLVALICIISSSLTTCRASFALASTQELVASSSDHFWQDKVIKMVGSFAVTESLLQDWLNMYLIFFGCQNTPHNRQIFLPYVEKALEQYAIQQQMVPSELRASISENVLKDAYVDYLSGSFAEHSPLFLKHASEPRFYSIMQDIVLHQLSWSLLINEQIEEEKITPERKKESEEKAKQRLAHPRWLIMRMCLSDASLAHHIYSHMLTLSTEKRLKFFASCARFFAKNPANTQSWMQEITEEEEIQPQNQNSSHKEKGSVVMGKNHDGSTSLIIFSEKRPSKTATSQDLLNAVRKDEAINIEINMHNYARNRIFIHRYTKTPQETLKSSANPQPIEASNNKVDAAVTDAVVHETNALRANTEKPSLLQDPSASSALEAMQNTTINPKEEINTYRQSSYNDLQPHHSDSATIAPQNPTRTLFAKKHQPSSNKKIRKKKSTAKKINNNYSKYTLPAKT